MKFLWDPLKTVEEVHATNSLVPIMPVCISCSSPRTDNSEMPTLILIKKICHAHLHFMVIICMKFHWNPLKTVEEVRVTRIRPTDRPTDRPTNTVTPIYPPPNFVVGV